MRIEEDPGKWNKRPRIILGKVITLLQHRAVILVLSLLCRGKLTDAIIQANHRRLADLLLACPVRDLFQLMYPSRPSVASMK